MTDLFDLAILGGGPAGTAAGVYASRKKLKTILIASEFGGQSVVSTDIQNWIGTVSINGNDLGVSFKKHLEAYAEDTLDIQTGENVSKVAKDEDNFVITTENGSSYTARSVLVATGAHRRKLPVTGADEFEHKGLTYCATCDGPLFAGKDVVVIGGR